MNLSDMSAFELGLFTLAVYWRNRWQDCNPEVGMGPLLQTVIKATAKQADIRCDDEEIVNIVANDVFKMELRK